MSAMTDHLAKVREQARWAEYRTRWSPARVTRRDAVLAEAERLIPEALGDDERSALELALVPDDGNRFDIDVEPLALLVDHVYRRRTLDGPGHDVEVVDVLDRCGAKFVQFAYPGQPAETVQVRSIDWFRKHYGPVAA